MPKTYLSVSTNQAGVRQYRCIRGGMPLCADSPEPDAAVEAYQFVFRYATAPVVAPLWDGDRRVWDEVSLERFAAQGVPL